MNKKDVFLRKNTTTAVERQAHQRSEFDVKLLRRTFVRTIAARKQEAFDMLISKCLPKDRRSFNWLLLSSVAMLAAAGCSTRATSNPSPSLTPAAATAVEEGVRGLMRTVATDVSQHGPLAWRNYFDPGPSFFMAVNGRMAFPTGAAASEGTEAFAKTIQHIELAWGDVRVDPLTPEFAMVAAPWREVQVDTAGHRVDESGFFSAITEYRGGRWQFRDAHWSSALTGIRGF